MRRVLAVVLCAALLPMEAFAQVRVRTGVVGSMPTGIPSLSASPVSAGLPAVSLPLNSSSLIPSLTPSMQPSIQSVVSIPAVPAAPAPVKAAAAAPLKPQASLSHASSRLSAAIAPDRPALEGRQVSDEIFSGALSAPSQDDDLPSVSGKQSDPKPALSPATPAAKPAKKEPLVARWRSLVTSGSAPLVIAAFAWNFLTIAAYSVIGPARAALLMTKFEPSTLPWVYLASAALTGVVVAGYNRYAKKASRKALIGGSLVMLAATLAGGALAVSAAAVPAVSFSYYLWTDVFGIMSMTLFWTYANDVFTRDESKRTFGLIAAGAPLGSIAGALLMKALVGSMGPVPMLMVAAGIFAAVLPIFFWMERRAKDRAAKDTNATEDAAAPEPAQGILKTILKSPFLLFLTALVALERLVPDITNYLYSVAAKAAYGADATGMAQMFADVNFWSSIASFGVSSLLVGLTLKKIGVGGSLMTTALVNLALFLMFPFMPALAMVAALWGLEGVTRYTWFKTAKESTYSATDRDTIYRVKAFIEMFVYRFARGLAGLLLLGVAWAGGGATAAAMVGVPLALFWLYAAWRVGREHKKLEDANKAAGK